MFVAAAALAPSHGPAPKGGLRAKSGGRRPAGLALEQEPPKEITKDMFGQKFEGGQDELCYQYLMPIVAGIVAGCVKVCCVWNPPCYMFLDAISFIGSIFGILTLFLVFGNAHNGTRLWDQLDNSKSNGGLSTSCYWVVVLAVWQCVQCACLCCCTGLLVTAAVAGGPNPTVSLMKMEMDAKRELKQMVSKIKTPEFRKKCDDMFQEADKNGDGSLDASELRAFAVASLPQSAQDDPLFYETFDKNGDKQLSKDEFYEMMVFFEVNKRINDY